MKLVSERSNTTRWWAWKAASITAQKRSPEAMSISPRTVTTAPLSFGRMVAWKVSIGDTSHLDGALGVPLLDRARQQCATRRGVKQPPDSVSAVQRSAVRRGD